MNSRKVIRTNENFIDFKRAKKGFFYLRYASMEKEMAMFKEIDDVKNDF